MKILTFIGEYATIKQINFQDEIAGLLYGKARSEPPLPDHAELQPKAHFRSNDQPNERKYDMSTMADRLLMVIMLVSAILMAILLVNNIFLYKQKFKDYISLMLIFGIAKCAFETLWICMLK